METLYRLSYWGLLLVALRQRAKAYPNQALLRTTVRQLPASAAIRPRARLRFSVAGHGAAASNLLLADSPGTQKSP
ncbi:hypothetical protein, partial [Streptomyces sp. MBT51]|uniref:hypothetical protein n=1 Tax=Streptomyces sp. MBT51 TaxID=2800408 RepID=UPI001F284E8C